jgi:hypothetical protein
MYGEPHNNMSITTVVNRSHACKMPSHRSIHMVLICSVYIESAKYLEHADPGPAIGNDLRLRHMS